MSPPTMAWKKSTKADKYTQSAHHTNYIQKDKRVNTFFVQGKGQKHIKSIKTGQSSLNSHTRVYNLT